MYNIDTSDLEFKNNNSEYVLIRIYYENYEIEKEIEVSKRENVDESLDFINNIVYNMIRENSDNFYSIHIIRKNE